MQLKGVTVLLVVTSLVGTSYPLWCTSSDKGDDVLQLVGFRIFDATKNDDADPLKSLPLSGHSGIYVKLDVDVKDRLPSDATFSLSITFPEAWVRVPFSFEPLHLPISCQSLVPNPVPSCYYSNRDCSEMEEFLAGSSFDCPLAPGQYRNLFGRDHIFPVPNLWPEIPALARPFVQKAGGTAKLVISSGGRNIACVEASVEFHV
ncbi:uncharacterized protein LOC116616132 [Nematostella vectensis]|uniref:uncharacterized protein LOC116616132 n=1 Tax=Nematostella vectensis TaxID=45351 RepID=UPI00138FBD26|nr:uncharacterized protein LOC116616132 [Nematostella vectensis]XP_032233925.1 uncharacterized protein LOC116616132 [Nematostella vectensis]